MWRYFSSIHDRRLSLGLLGGALISASIIAGIVPDVRAPHWESTFSTAALADVSDGQLQRYARAVRSIEPLRQRTLNRVMQIQGGSLPSLACDDPSSVNSLSSQARSLFLGYCQQASEIASANGLSLGEFNEIAAEVRGNSRVRARLRDILR
jgi:hypothetical protein